MYVWYSDYRIPARQVIGKVLEPRIYVISSFYHAWVRAKKDGAEQVANVSATA
jgi:hypothetical protein